MRRQLALVWLLAVVGAACGTGATDGDSAEVVGVEQLTPSPHEEVPSALADPDDDRLPQALVDTGEIISGGPPPDGIPAIDEPRFERASSVTWLDDEEPVLALEVGDEWRAYPVQILTWHEIVNDTIAGMPVAVTYCPLCNTAIAYDRRAADRLLEFGTSGRLYRSALVMYDRQTESLWAHFTGSAVAGVLTGTQLDTFPISTVSWRDFRDRAPGDALVLSRETGYSRDYGRNPYPGYDDVDSSPFLFEGEVDGRLAAKERVVGLEEAGGEAIAVRTAVLAEQRVIATTLDGEPLTVWWKAGTASALDDDSVSDGQDVGATGAFRPVAAGRQLTFEADGDAFVDLQTRTRWDVLGHATSGPLAGQRLDPVPHVDTFWFAWAAYRPETVLVP